MTVIRGTILFRRTVVIASLALASIGIGEAGSYATFPGVDGPIAFRTIDPETGLGKPLYSALPDGTGVSVLTRRAGFFSDWRADGERIAFDFFERDGDEQIATMDADGGNLRVITSGHGIHEVPSWSPNGRRIVFNFSPDLPDERGFETRLWTMRANGSDARRLSMSERGFDIEPRYSPDGDWIAFMRLRTSPFQQAVFIVKTQGSHRVRQLTPWRLSSEHPNWSPDGRWIAFNSPEGTIRAVRPNGRKRQTIVPASDGFGGHKPWFSPDGSRILFMCENWGTLPKEPDDYNEDICVMDADGSNIVKVVNTPDTLENWPSWGPAPE